MRNDIKNAIAFLTGGVDLKLRSKNVTITHTNPQLQIATGPHTMVLNKDGEQSTLASIGTKHSISFVEKTDKKGRVVYRRDGNQIERYTYKPRSRNYTVEKIWELSGISTITEVTFKKNTKTEIITTKGYVASKIVTTTDGNVETSRLYHFTKKGACYNDVTTVTTLHEDGTKTVNSTSVDGKLISYCKYDALDRIVKQELCHHKGIIFTYKYFKDTTFFTELCKENLITGEKTYETYSEFDKNGNIVKYINYSKSENMIKYNDNNQPIEIVTTREGVPNFTINIGYDEDGFVSTITKIAENGTIIDNYLFVRNPIHFESKFNRSLYGTNIIIADSKEDQDKIYNIISKYDTIASLFVYNTNNELEYRKPLLLNGQVSYSSFHIITKENFDLLINEGLKERIFTIVDYRFDDEFNLTLDTDEVKQINMGNLLTIKKESMNIFYDGDIDCLLNKLIIYQFNGLSIIHCKDDKVVKEVKSPNEKRLIYILEDSEVRATGDHILNIHITKDMKTAEYIFVKETSTLIQNINRHIISKQLLVEIKDFVSTLDNTIVNKNISKVKELLETIDSNNIYLFTDIYKVKMYLKKIVFYYSSDSNEYKILFRYIDKLKNFGSDVYVLDDSVERFIEIGDYISKLIPDLYPTVELNRTWFDIIKRDKSVSISDWMTLRCYIKRISMYYTADTTEYKTLKGYIDDIKHIINNMN